MQTVNQLLDLKGRKVYFVAPEASVFEALTLMAEKEIGALPVVEVGRLVGLVSERDYARKVILKGHSSKELRVRDIMSREPMCARPDDTVEGCMEVMTNQRVRHLPVLNDGELAGLVSIGDLVKSVIAEQQYVIEQMQSYISG